MSFDPKTILIYTYGEKVGDSVRSAKMIKAAMESFPNAKITYGYNAGTGFNTELKEAFPDMNLLRIDYHKFRYFFKKNSLKQHKFDLVIDKQRIFRVSLFLKLKTKHKKFVSGSAGWLLSDIRPKSLRKKVSVLEQEMHLIEAITKKEILPKPSILYDDKKYKAIANAVIPLEKVTTIGLVAGSGRATKSWPHYKELAKKLHQKNYRIVIFLGPLEEDWYEEYKKELPYAIFPLQSSKVPEKDFNKIFYTIELGKRLDLSVTNDCGTAHMLAEALIPQISLFGRTSSAKHSLFGEHYNISSQELYNTKDISTIPVDMVYDKVIEVLKSKGKD